MVSILEGKVFKQEPCLILFVSAPVSGIDLTHRKCSEIPNADEEMNKRSRSDLPWNKHSIRLDCH